MSDTPQFLRKRGTDLIFGYNPELGRRRDMEAYDGPLPNAREPGQASEHNREIRVDGELMPIGKATKDQLEAFAREYLDVELDKRKTKTDLVDEVLELIAAKEQE